MVAKDGWPHGGLGKIGGSRAECESWVAPGNTGKDERPRGPAPRPGPEARPRGPEQAARPVAAASISGCPGEAAHSCSGFLSRTEGFLTESLARQHWQHRFGGRKIG